MSEVTCPKPGIYPGMSFADYAAIPAMNVSTLAWARDSMAHLRAAMDGKLSRQDSPAMAFGRALHIRLLEPDRFAAAVKLRGTCEAALTSGKRKGQPCGCNAEGMYQGHWLCGKHADAFDEPIDGVEYLSPDEMASIERCAASVKSHGAEKLRRANGQYEVVAIADLMGIRCKARLDKWISKPATIVDVKTVRAPAMPGDASVAERFDDKIEYYGYGMQAAMYCDVMQALTGMEPRWFWLVVESGEPYSTGCFQASSDLLNAGRNQYRAYLTSLSECQASGVWPGLTRDVEMIDGPRRWRQRNGN